MDARIDPDSRSRPRRIGDWLRRARAEIRADRARANGDVGADASVDDGALARPPPPGADTRSRRRARRALDRPRTPGPRVGRASTGSRRARRGAPRATRPALAGAADIHPRRARALFRCRSRPPRRSGRASRPAPSLAPRVAPALRARHAPRAPRPAPRRRDARVGPRGSLDGARPSSSSPRRGARDDDDDADAPGAGGGGAARARSALLAALAAAVVSASPPAAFAAEDPAATAAPSPAPATEGRRARDGGG